MYVTATNILSVFLSIMIVWYTYFQGKINLGNKNKKNMSILKLIQCGDLAWHQGDLAWHQGDLAWHQGDLAWHPGITDSPESTYFLTSMMTLGTRKTIQREYLCKRLIKEETVIAFVHEFFIYICVLLLSLPNDAHIQIYCHHDTIPDILGPNLGLGVL